MNLLSRHTRARAALPALCVLVVLRSAAAGATGPADQAGATLVEVPLRASQTVSVPGATQVLALEDSICRAELTPGGIRLVGLSRGESVVFVWVGDRRSDLLVRVVPPVLAKADPLRSTEQMAQRGQGTVGSSVQMAIDPAGAQTFHFQHQFNWSQQVDGRRFGLRGQAHDVSSPGTPLNVDGLSMEYVTPSVAVTVLDFGLSLNGGAEAHVPNASTLSSYVFRGADVAVTRGRHQVEIFAGTSVPSYYRSLRDTSRIAGVNLSRRQSAQLYVFSTTAGISVPQTTNGDAGRVHQNSIFHTSGLAYKPSDRWATQLSAGGSNRGYYGDGALAMTGNRVSAWAAATASSASFPLNQLHVLSGGGSSVRAGTTWKATSRVAASLLLQHSNTRAAPEFSSFAGTSIYVNPNVNLVISPSQSLTLNAVKSRNRGGLAQDAQLSTTSFDLGWTSQWLKRIVNSAQVSASQVDDRATGNVRVSYRDTLTMRVKGGNLSLGFQRNQHDPSLATRLRQQIGLLPGDLQEQFFADPAGFVASDRLPPEVRDLLDLVRSADAQASVSGQFLLGSRLNVSASYSLLQSSPRRDQRGRTNAFGYSLGWQLTRTLQIRSSLADTYVLDPRRNDITRSTTFLLGLSKALQGGPAWLRPSANQIRVDGRVFVDRNATGKFDVDEAGLAGIVVQLDGGQKATTDAAGRFHFTGLKPAAYHVSMALTQFREAVRVTTLPTVTVDLAARAQATVEFGIVNFSRVLGSVYNDYEGRGERRADSPGLPNVSAIVTDADGFERRVVTDGSGEYRIDDLPPGAYRVHIDPTTIPLNYAGPVGPVAFEVKPTRTAHVDVPLRAERSVAGHIYLQESPSNGSGEPRMEPAVGVTVVAGSIESTTDAAGRFVLRDLPAGDTVVTLRAVKPLSPGLVAPTGSLRLTKEPVQIQNAAIVVRSRDLLRYFYEQ